MNNTKEVRGQRLRQFLDLHGIKNIRLAEALNMSTGTVSQIVNGNKDISKNFVEKLSKWKPNINTEWLLFGTGEMLKFEKTEEKISPAALVQEGIYITKNLPALHRESGQSAAALSLQCGVPEHIFHSPSQEGGASYPFSVIDLARISRALDVPLDVLFFWDLSNPETMRDYQEHKQNTQAILESAATKKEVEELRRIIQEQGEKIEKILENYRELIEGLKK